MPISHSKAQSGRLTGIAAVQHAFYFLSGPADVCNASVSCIRWRAFGRSDALWRAKAKREGLFEKAKVFDVMLSGGPTCGESPHPEMTFYSTIYAIKVQTN